MTISSSVYEKARLRKITETYTGSLVLDLGYAQFL